MGLTVTVHRAPPSGYGDATNGGISGRFTELTVVNVDGPFRPTDDAPAVMLIPGRLAGTAILVPAIHRPHGPGDGYEAMPEDTSEYAGPMFGGNYAATSDSRFFRAIERVTGGHFYGAVPIHDRVESWDLYEAMSR